jgi:hypothetical protein
MPQAHGAFPCFVWKAKLSRSSDYYPVGIPPKLLRVVFALGIYCARIPIVFFTLHVRAALDQEDALAPRRKFPGQRAAARARTNDDEIVIAPVIHANSSARVPNPYAIFFSKESGGESTDPNATKLSDECPNRRHSSARFLFQSFLARRAPGPNERAHCVCLRRNVETTGRRDGVRGYSDIEDLDIRCG